VKTHQSIFLFRGTSRNPRVLGQPYRPYGRSSNSVPMHDVLRMMGLL
jgi:hypothetical protein